MTAKLTVEIDIKTIRKFAAFTDIELTDEHEKKLVDSATDITESEFNEFASDSRASLMFAGVILVKQLKDE